MASTKIYNFLTAPYRKVCYALEPLPPSTWPLQDDCTVKPKIRMQQKSLLFTKLSAELRILIYQAALGDPHRFLHICESTKQKRQSVSHYHCTDIESPYPTWQHSCYSDIPANLVFGVLMVQPTVKTKDKLLALLLTCRLIYSEALAILYQDNIFHFRGAPGLLKFIGSISPIQQQALHYIHISTVVTIDTVNYYSSAPPWPPEVLPEWQEACKTLGSLSNLRSLQLDITVMYRFEAWIDLVLKPVLEALRNLKVKVFEIELNVEVSENLKRGLGDVDFVITSRERPYNEQLYGTIDSLELGRRPTRTEEWGVWPRGIRHRSTVRETLDMLTVWR